MTVSEECELHETIGCSWCNPRPASPAEPDSRPFVARYDGQCPECNLPIVAGEQRIVLRDVGSHTVAIHQHCTDK